MLVPTTVSPYRKENLSVSVSSRALHVSVHNLPPFYVLVPTAAPALCDAIYSSAHSLAISHDNLVLLQLRTFMFSGLVNQTLEFLRVLAVVNFETSSAISCMQSFFLLLLSPLHGGQVICQYPCLHIQNKKPGHGCIRRYPSLSNT